MMSKNMTQEKLELKNRFHSANSSQEKLKLMTKMESCFQEDELGMEYLNLTEQLYKDKLFKKLLFFGKKGLKILLKNKIPCLDTDHTCEEHTYSVSVAFILQLLGNACLDLKLFDDSLNYLNWASKTLSKIELDVNSSCAGKCVLGNLCGVQSLLVKVKVHTGRKEESLVHLIKALDIMKVRMGGGCNEIGAGNRLVYKGYVWCGHFKEALPFCLEALEIFGKNLGGESVEVAKIMGDLAVIYNGLGEYEKALGQIKLAQGILKKLSSCSSDLLKVETEKGNVLIGLGRYEEAVDVLKGVFSRAPKDGREQAVALVSMARAYCDWQNFADAKKYMMRACKVLKRLPIGPTFGATVYGDMSRLYEKMNDFETAISWWSVVLSMPELPYKLHAEGVTRIFSLVSLTKKEKEMMPYLENVVERLKEALGPNHCEVGYSYSRLGLAYMKVGQQELVVKYMADAKDIMNISLGPHHLDSLKTMLSATYGNIKK